MGKSYWKVRWTPNEPGQWKAELTLFDAQQQKEWQKAVADAANKKKSADAKAVDAPKVDDFAVRLAAQTFECASSKSHGFVHVDAKDPVWFSYSDGTFFYPIGQMLRSPTDMRKPFSDYRTDQREDQNDRADAGGSKPSDLIECVTALGTGEKAEREQQCQRAPGRRHHVCDEFQRQRKTPGKYLAHQQQQRVAGRVGDAQNVGTGDELGIVVEKENGRERPQVKREGAEKHRGRRGVSGGKAERGLFRGAGIHAVL